MRRLSSELTVLAITQANVKENTQLICSGANGKGQLTVGRLGLSMGCNPSARVHLKTSTR